MLTGETLTHRALTKLYSTTQIEIPLPNEASRMEILKIHASKLGKKGDIDYDAVVKLAEVSASCVQSA